jgi:hypothetical protein
VRPKKKKKKKSKKDKRDSSRRAREEERENDDSARRSAVFKTLIPPSMMMSHGGAKKSFSSSINKDDLAAIGYEIDPNDDLPTFTSGMSDPWNPAALVTAAQSKLSDGRIDKHGFYTNIKVHADSAYGKVHTLMKGKSHQIDSNFNLHSIGKSKKKPYAQLQKQDSIVWGDESVTDRDVAPPRADHEGNDTDMHNKSDWIELVDAKADGGSDGLTGITMVDDCSFSELNEANEHYLMNEKLIRKLMWQRDRRRLGLCSIAMVVLFCIWLAIHIGLSNRSSPPHRSSTPRNDDSIERNAPPARPLPPAPIEPTDGFDDGPSSHAVTSSELHYIVNQITPDSSILMNPHSPQAKAFEWCKNDIKIYSVGIKSRVAQRYALATLYYSTNGTHWATNKVNYSIMVSMSASKKPQFVPNLEGKHLFKALGQWT